jgi:membrane protein implicated in regulation of membrane protease activity
MPWWGWIVVGVVLLAGELVADAQFYLVFLGAAAVLTGLLGVAGLSGGVAVQWAIFGGLAVVLLVGFRRRVYGHLRGTTPPGHESIVGEVAVVQEAIAPGALGRAELRGTSWTARNVGSEALAAGQRAQVARLEGLVIDVRRAE